MNEATSAMIKTLHARLNDLQVVVDKFPSELEGYDAKLDKIDDQVYFLIVELEKKLAALESAESVEGAPAEIGAEGAEDASEPAESQEGGEVAEQENVAAAEGEASSEEKRVLKGGIFNEDYELTPKARETISSAAQSFSGFLKEAKGMTSELSDVKKDLDEALDFLPKSRRIRRR